MLVISNHQVNQQVVAECLRTILPNLHCHSLFQVHSETQAVPSHVRSDATRLARGASAATHRLRISDSTGVRFQELGIDLAVAQGAVAQFERTQGRLEGLMLADLAGVVFLGQDALPASNTRREVAATLTA